MTRIPITRPCFGEKELKAVQCPIETGWVVQGPFVAEFERQFAEFTGAAFALATSSCTTALHTALVCLDVKPGDEVIVPAFTWVATPNVVEYMSARPVFCDIDLDTFNIDSTQIEAHVTDRTVGIIPVHLFGLCADMDPIREIASRHNLWVVEDAACAFGATYSGQHAGTLADIGCFSFHPRKNITTGEGGMLTTSHEGFHARACSLRDHGASCSDHARHTSSDPFVLPEFEQVGFNYRMTDIQAALGCAQIERARWILGERHRRARRYDEMLRDIDWLTTPHVPEGYRHGYQAYVCLLHPEAVRAENMGSLPFQRSTLMAWLEKVGIATRPGTHAPTLLDYYANKYSLRPEAHAKARVADRLSLGLPLFPQMTDEQQDLVVQQLVACAARCNG